MIQNTLNNSADNDLYVNSSENDATSLSIIFKKSRGPISPNGGPFPLAGPDAGAKVVASDNIGSIFFYGYTGTAFVPAAKIFAEVTALSTVAAGQVAGTLNFQTHPDAGTPALTRLIIDSAGSTIMKPNGATTIMSVNTAGVTIPALATNGIVYYTGTVLASTAVGTAGDVLTSQGAGLPPVFAAPAGSGVTSITGTANQIDVDVPTGAVTLSTPVTFTGPGYVAATTNFLLPSSSSTAGNIIWGTGGATQTLHTTGSSSNVITNIFFGANTGNYTTTTVNSIGLGAQVLSSISNGTDNVAIGYGTLNAATSDSFNICIGSNSGTSLQNGATGNVGIGFNTIQSVFGGLYNAALGYAALDQIGAGGGTNSYNIGIGYQAGHAYTNHSESSNICLNSAGVNNESNVLRIGNATGSGVQELSKAFIQGIYNITPDVASPQTVVIDSNGQLGSVPSGTTLMSYTAVNHAASPYTVLTTDDYIGADVTAGVITLLFPNAPATGRTFIIKDVKGLAAASNITVTSVGGAILFDGATSFVMSTAFESISILFDGVGYQIW